MLEISLYKGRLVILTPLTPKLDAPIIASRTFGLEFPRFFPEDSPRPLAKIEIRKQIEE